LPGKDLICSTLSSEASIINDSQDANKAPALKVILGRDVRERVDQFLYQRVALSDVLQQRIDNELVGIHSVRHDVHRVERFSSQDVMSDSRQPEMRGEIWTAGGSSWRKRQSVTVLTPRRSASSLRRTI
jgi:hypothetical protein